MDIAIAVAVLSILVVAIVAFWHTPVVRRTYVERIYLGRTHVETGMIDENTHLQCTEEEFYEYLNRWMEVNGLTMDTFYPMYMYKHRVEYHPVMVRRGSMEVV